MLARAKTPDFTVSIVREVLNDGSEVFNVHLGEVLFPAVTRQHALALAVKISQAIEEHTTSTATVKLPGEGS